MERFIYAVALKIGMENKLFDANDEDAAFDYFPWIGASLLYLEHVVYAQQ